MSGILAKLEAAFDPGAGLADIYARSTARHFAGSPPYPGPSAPPATPAPGRGSSRLAAVCDQIDTLTAWLSGLLQSGQQDPFSGSSYLDLASDNLVQLRAGLASRTMTRHEAEQLTSDIQSQLSQADRLLRSQHGTTLDDMASGHDRRSESLTGQARVIREMVARLFEPGHDLALTPVR
jgi:hypothetical protein